MRAGIFGLLLTFCLLGIGAARAAVPLLTSIRPDVPTYPQFFEITQSRDRLLYVGATDEVLRYDGVRWRRIALTRPGPVRTLLTDRRGRVWVGGFGTFGYLRRDADGDDTYVEVSSRFPPLPDERGFADTWRAIEFGDAIYFGALRDVYVVDLDGQPLKRWHHEGRFGELLGAREGLYLQWRGEGLKRLVGDEFQLVPGGETFAEKLIYNIWQLPDDRLLVYDVLPRLMLSTSKGFRRVTTFDGTTELDRLAVGIAMEDERLLFSSSDGLMRVIDWRKGTSEHIPVGDGFVTTPFRDADGAIWVTCEESLYRLSWPVQWRAHDRRDGLLGQLHRLDVFGDRLYASSTAGIAVAPLQNRDIAGPFTVRPWTTDEGWAIWPDGEGFLLADARSLLSVRDDTVQAISGDDLYPRLFVPALGRDDVMWLGTEVGLAVLRRERGQWRLARHFDTLAAHVTSIVEASPGELWLGTDDKSLLRVRIDADALTLLEHTPIDASLGVDAPPFGEAHVARLGEDLIVSVPGALLRFDGQRFAPTTLDGLAGVIGPNDVVSLLTGPDGTQWAYSFRTVYRRPPGGAWSELPWSSARVGVVETLVPQDEGRALIGSGSRILAFTPAPASTMPASATVPTVSVARLRWQPAGEAPPRDLSLEGDASALAGSGSLVFDLAFTAYSGAGAPRFRARLRGVESSFSPWAERATFGYGALPPGEYVFEAQARRAGGEIFPAPPLRVRILPRWYETDGVRLAAVAVGALLIAALFFVGLRLRTAHLAARAQELDGLVAERTSELAEANDRLRDLAERDGLTGVANRRRFDETLSLAFERARLLGEALSLLLIDVDHFKRFNDTHGHLAGDQQLRRVATILAAHGGPGVLVARYGGEEFAVIAREHDAQAAPRLAEILRRAIETELSGTTVSIGVSTLHLARHASTAALIDDADQALYRAKHDGRNRVAAA